MLEILVLVVMVALILSILLSIYYIFTWRRSIPSFEVILTLCKSYWRIIFFIAIAILLSSIRAVFVDIPVVVSDNYDDYAVILSRWLGDININLDESLGGVQVPIRMVYSLIIAIPLLVFPVDIVILGRVISLLSFLITIPLLYRIINFTNLIKSQERKELVLILYVTNVTLMTSLIRFATDMFFLAILMATIVVYLEYTSRPFREARHILFPLAILCILLLFTREVSFLLFGSLILHQLYIQNRRIKFAIFGVIVVSIITSVLLGVLDDILYYVVWTATSYGYADALIHNGDLSILITPFISKFLNEYILLTTLTSAFFAFGIALVFSIVGMFYMLKHPEKRAFFRSFIFLYLLVFVCFYLFLKLGRGLDRFFMPALFIPYLTLPLGIRVAIYGPNDSDEGDQIPEKERLLYVTLILAQLFIFFLRMILSYIGDPL